MSRSTKFYTFTVGTGYVEVIDRKTQQKVGRFTSRAAFNEWVGKHVSFEQLDLFSLP